MAKEIRLANGMVAIVDDEDYQALAKWKWCYQKPRGRRRTGYAIRKCEGRTLGMHTAILGCPLIDHKDGDCLNNRRSNIRPATRGQNEQNKGKGTYRAFTSRYKGVRWVERDKRWRATIKTDGRRIALGQFQSEEAAARAYDAAAREIFGEFARCNFP